MWQRSVPAPLGRPSNEFKSAPLVFPINTTIFFFVPFFSFLLFSSHFSSSRPFSFMKTLSWRVSTEVNGPGQCSELLRSNTSYKLPTHAARAPSQRYPGQRNLQQNLFYTQFKLSFSFTVKLSTTAIFKNMQVKPTFQISSATSPPLSLLSLSSPSPSPLPFPPLHLSRLVRATASKCFCRHADAQRISNVKGLRTKD